MGPDAISYVNLIIAVATLLTAAAALIVSIIALRADRHEIRALSIAVDDGGDIFMQVQVANGGKRPIAIMHVQLKPSSHPGVYLDFSTAPGGGKIDVGDSRSCEVKSSSLAALPIAWKSVEEMRAIRVSVVDALGRQYEAPWLTSR